MYVFLRFTLLDWGDLMKIKGLQLTDVLIIVLMSLIIALDMDFGSLATIDYVCLGAFAFWLVALAVRLYITNKE